MLILEAATCLMTPPNYEMIIKRVSHWISSELAQSKRFLNQTSNQTNAKRGVDIFKTSRLEVL